MWEDKAALVTNWQVPLAQSGCCWLISRPTSSSWERAFKKSTELHSSNFSNASPTITHTQPLPRNISRMSREQVYLLLIFTWGRGRLEARVRITLWARIFVLLVTDVLQWTGNWMTGVRFSAETGKRIFRLPYSIHAGSGVHPAFHPKGTGVFSRE